MALYAKLKVPLWIGTWIVTRAFIVAQVGYWLPDGANFTDVYVYEGWSNFMVDTGILPQEETWQYPPGAAFLFLIPRIGPLEYGTTFVVLMLLVDLIGFWLMSRFAKEGKRDVGVWVWLLAMPMLFFLPVLRFDLVPTVIAMAALLVIHRRPGLFGALIGLGAMIKVWPVFLLLAEWNRKRLLQAAGAAAAVAVVIFAAAALFYAEPFRFMTNQGDRGLQVEAVAASPWELRHLVTGTEPPIAQRYGTNEIDSDLAEAVSLGLETLTILLLAGAVLWWWLRAAAIRRGRTDLEDASVSRDFAFTVILLFLVVSRVLSPQFMIWMVGLSAVVLSSRGTRVARPAWIVIGAVVLTAGLYQSPANFVIRNLALLYAAIDAAVVLTLLVLDRKRDEAPEPALAEPSSKQPA